MRHGKQRIVRDTTLEICIIAVQVCKLTRVDNYVTYSPVRVTFAERRSLRAMSKGIKHRPATSKPDAAKLPGAKSAAGSPPGVSRRWIPLRRSIDRDRPCLLASNVGAGGLEGSGCDRVPSAEPAQPGGAP